MAPRPQRFQISLEKQVYFPGELLKGVLHIEAQQEIPCRGIRIHLQGKGHSHIRTGSGDNENHYYHTQFYTNCKRTVYGNVSKTPILDEVGENAIFGPPWAPDEGVIYLNIPTHAEELVLRVMDYEWMKRDNLLGEVLVNAYSCIGKGEMECPLMRNGKPESGVVNFFMDWDSKNDTVDRQGNVLKCLKVTIVKAVGLRKAEWFGKNDVYVQIYAKPENTSIVSGKALPDPVVNVSLPAGMLDIPFEFQLPNDLPSTIVKSTDNYITYSIYANIDIAWALDPSTRVFFTVMQPHPTHLMMYPANAFFGTNLHPQCCIPPCCCCSFSLPCCGTYGKLDIKASTDRTAYAPGETVNLTLDVSSTWTDFQAKFRGITVDLTQHVHLWAQRVTRTDNYKCFTQSYTDRGLTSISFTIPPVPPSYNGGLGKDVNWFSKVSRYGAVWSQSKPDPIVWNYTIDVSVSLALPGIALFSRTFTASVPIVISGIPLSILPPLEGVVLTAPIMLTNSSMNRDNNSDIPQAVVLPDWKGDNRIPQIYGAVRDRGVTTVTLDPAFVVRDEQEDHNPMYANDLNYRPVYLVVRDT